MGMDNKTTQGAKMQNQGLIEALKAEGIISGPREKTETQWWLADGSQRFLSIRDGNVTLWQNFMPFHSNECGESMPLEQATPETVAALISQAW